MRRYLSFIAVFMASAMAADIPIREVILYKSGVGYFARAGTLRPGGADRGADILVGEHVAGADDHSANMHFWDQATS